MLPNKRTWNFSTKYVQEIYMDKNHFGKMHLKFIFGSYMDKRDTRKITYIYFLAFLEVCFESCVLFLHFFVFRRQENYKNSHCTKTVQPHNNFKHIYLYRSNSFLLAAFEVQGKDICAVCYILMLQN